MQKSQIRLVILPISKNNHDSSNCLFYTGCKYDCILDIVWLDNALFEISKNFVIQKIDIVGTGFNFLSEIYFDFLFNVLKLWHKKMYVYTDFKALNPALINNYNSINVLFDFNTDLSVQRKVLAHIKAADNTDKVINLKVFDQDCNSLSPHHFINILNSMYIKSFEIIPFYPIEGTNQQFKGFTYFENTVKTYLKLADKMQFAFQNKLQIEKVLTLDNYNVTPIYITPDRKFGIQKFRNNHLFIEKTDNIQELIKKVTEMENFRDNFCRKCTSSMRCLANYFVDLEESQSSCCGFKGL